MKAKINSYERQDFYQPKRFNDIAILKFGKNFLFEAIERAIENPLLDVLDHIAANDRIKALVIMNCLEQIGREAYIGFCRQVFNAEVDRTSIQRMCNVFDQLILKIVGLNVRIRIASPEGYHPEKAYYIIDGRVVRCEKVNDEKSRFGLGIQILHKTIEAHIQESRFK